MRIERMTDTAIAEKLGEAIKAHRLKKNISQAALADEIGVSIPTVANLEKGSAKLEVLIAALRAMRMLDKLQALMEPPLPSPRSVVLHSAANRLKASGSAKGVAFARANPRVTKG